LCAFEDRNKEEGEKVVSSFSAVKGEQKFKAGQSKQLNTPISKVGIEIEDSYCLTPGSIKMRSGLSTIWIGSPTCSHEIAFFKKNPQYQSHVQQVAGFGLQENEVLLELGV